MSYYNPSTNQYNTLGGLKQIYGNHLDPDKLKSLGWCELLDDTNYLIKDSSYFTPGKLIKSGDKYYRTYEPTIQLLQDLETREHRISGLIGIIKSMVQSWAADTGYNEGDYVIHNDEIYLAVSSNFNNSPDANDPLDWQPLNI